MSATINSILARCIVDTAFLNQLASDPAAALRAYSLDPQIYSDFLKLDVARLRHFAGLVTKVQNNGLWEHFSHTRTLLNYYHLDLEVFTDYRDTHLQNRQAQLSRNQQIERFLSFLQKRLEPDYPRFPALREILLHEQLTWQLRISFSTGIHQPTPMRPTDISAINYATFVKLIPIKPDLLRIERFSYDPLEIISKLTQEKFNSGALKEKPKWLGYWADGSSGHLRILELDKHIAVLLREIDGRRSIRSLVRHVMKHSQSGVRPSEFRPFISLALAEGLLATSDNKSSLYTNHGSAT